MPKGTQPLLSAAPHDIARQRAAVTSTTVPRRRATLEKPGQPPFRQLRFYDFNVWSQKKRVEKLQYMHLNPVKRGLVAHPKDGPWSNFSFYSRRGPDQSSGENRHLQDRPAR